MVDLSFSCFLPEDLKVTGLQKNEAVNHVFLEKDCRALWSAYASGRPLLVKGEPGTGKSQLAKAISRHLGWALVEEVINYHTELNDLFYHFDAVQRLADAQVADEDKRTLAANDYLSPGPLWWAFDWQLASEQYENVSCQHRPVPYQPEMSAHKKGVVLLLDEIDKAQPELANGLLGALGNREFVVPYAPNPIRLRDDTNLLVVITSNDERELPKAFIRRCFVHTLSMETGSQALDEKLPPREKWLVERGQIHFGDAIKPSVYERAASMLWADRDEAYGDEYKPGLAEYIDLLQVLSTLGYEDQVKTIDDIAQFALCKRA